MARVIEKATGLVDGANTTYTVQPYEAGSLQVWRNGRLVDGDLDDGFVETDPPNGIFDMKSAPVLNDVIWAYLELA